MDYSYLHYLRFESQDLKYRATVAVALAAQAVRTEDGKTPGHALRLQWATDALTNAEGMAERMSWDIVTSPSIYAKGRQSNDADVQAVVDGLINKFAGVN